MVLSVFAIKYPTLYSDIIKTEASNTLIDKKYIYSIISVESNFREKAVSSKGAIGLMQVMPDTCKFVCEMYNYDFDVSKLYTADYNIKIGTHYLKYLINKFSDVNVAICAYNAGEGNVSAWLNDNVIVKDNLKNENIPFKETRNYVRKVNNAYFIYKFKVK